MTPSSGVGARSARLPWLVFPAVFAAAAAAAVRCPGSLDVGRSGPRASLVNAAWNTPGATSGDVEVLHDGTLSAGLQGRTYFADECFEEDSLYNRSHYRAMRLLGRSVRYTVDLAGVGCGCNAAVYLTAMRQNREATQCMDHYCDANAVCGESCAEIDLQEANAHAFRTTLHTSEDRGGVGVGLGPDLSHWTSEDYGPGGRCVDTSRPFSVQVAFPATEHGSLRAVEVTLSQDGSACPLRANVTSYRFGGEDGMRKLSRALEDGMTLVVSYWSSRDMAWLDGNSSESPGLCEEEKPGECSGRVSFGNFSVQDVHGKEAPGPPPDRGSCDCPAGRSPVCGMDGKTYSSSCVAHCSGVVVYSAGRCRGHSTPIPSSAGDGPSTTWTPQAESVPKICPTATYDEQEGAFLDGAFPAGTAGCRGSAECQFRTMEGAQEFCNGQPDCAGLLRHPLPNDCHGGLGCFTPRRVAAAAAPPLFGQLGGRCWILTRGTSECGARPAAGNFSFAGYLRAHEAQGTCAAFGGLPVPSRPRDLRALRDAMAAAAGARKLEPEGRQSAVWLGGQWNSAAARWEREDGSEVAGIDWAEGEPSAAEDQAREPWLRMTPDGKVHDTDPRSLYGTICERGAGGAASWDEFQDPFLPSAEVRQLRSSGARPSAGAAAAARGPRRRALPDAAALPSVASLTSLI